MKPGRVAGQLHLGARRHAVEASVKVTKEGRVVLEVLRESRQRAAGDLSLELSPDAARQLMRRLQGGADEADRRAYALAKSQTDIELDRAVDAVAKLLSRHEPAGGASTSHPCGCAHPFGHLSTCRLAQPGTAPAHPGE